MEGITNKKVLITAGATGIGGSVAVPEPSAYALLGGLFALTCVMLRRRA